MAVSEDAVAQVYPHAREWDAGRWSLASLCTQAGWPLPEGDPPAALGPAADVLTHYLRRGLDRARGQRPTTPGTDQVHDIAEELHALRLASDKVTAQLTEALVAADRAARDKDGTPSRSHREALVRAAERVISRAMVFGVLGTADVLADAQRALAPAWQHMEGYSLLQLAGRAVILRGPAGGYARVRNEGVTLVELLHDAGLTVTSNGPGRPAEALTAGHGLVISRP
ncbi:hypothetical protein [Streptomyces leeuwenhoekii]|nr:hypothetical protein [Streptomyces leeuwenhoekii]